MAAIIVLSLIPQTDRVETGLSGKSEHFLAYFVTGVLLAFSSSKRGRLVTVAGLASLAFVLEALQYVAPGRHPRFTDAMVGALAAVLGAVVAAWLRRRIDASV